MGHWESSLPPSWIWETSVGLHKISKLLQEQQSLIWKPLASQLFRNHSESSRQLRRTLFYFTPKLRSPGNYFLLGEASSFTKNNTGLGDSRSNKYSLESQLNVQSREQLKGMKYSINIKKNFLLVLAEKARYAGSWASPLLPPIPFHPVQSLLSRLPLAWLKCT